MKQRIKKSKSRFSGLDAEFKAWKAGTKKLRTTVSVGKSERVAFRASEPELKTRLVRMTEFKKLRDGLGLSQIEMAEALHVNFRTLQGWEIGKSSVPDPVLILAELLHDLPAVRKRLLAA
jgi:DNA-binding transcriptional regulator YiaG